MSAFTIHTSETAPAASQVALDQAKAKYGMVPNLIGGLAESAPAAEAYLALSELAGRTSFTPTERHVIWFTINAEHECHYCMAAHTAIAHSEAIEQSVIDTAREVGRYDDPRLETLRQFTLQMVQQRGWVPEEDVQAFLDAGFTRAQVLEVVTLIAHKTISNYTNHLLETPVDPPFAKFEWTAPAAA